ncbi:MAG: hypothetical protein ACOH2F_21095 [Cellulomonas sp.]
MTPEITYAGVSADGSELDASSYVPRIIESDGTCTFRVSAGAEKFSLAQPAVADATTTSCGSVTIPLGGSGVRTWTMVVEYRSPSSSGDSLPMTVRAAS